jgi:hypothetical protein
MRQNSAAMFAHLVFASGRIRRHRLTSAEDLTRMRMSFLLRRLVVLAACFLAPLLFAQGSLEKQPSGVAWRVIGSWHTRNNNGTVSDGDAIVPGSLLEPEPTEHDHSITILLSDGQRIFYECFAERDCARGFRVPPLYRKPDPAAVDLLKRVNAVERRNRTVSPESQRQSESTARDESVALIGTDNTVEIAGLPAALSDGVYSYTVRSLSHSSSAQPRREFRKQGKSVKLTLPSEGLFEIMITDRLNTPRIDLLLAAVHKQAGSGIVDSFHKVEALLRDWNEEYQGWPVHEFKRDYLRSVMLGIAPSRSAGGTLSRTPASSQSPDVACEPEFRPIPGVFKTDTEVRLQCSTPGVTIRYTVDGSQPLVGSAVYRAPIMVKGTALTIKAFATAPGKKDSPVVTGIFRIGD